MQKFFTLLALLAALAFLPSRLQAQDTGNSGQDNANATTVTGCLQAGTKAGRFMLTADDGTVYHLRSKSVDLGEHVGHTVTITGHVPQRHAQGGQAPSNTSSPDATDEAAQAAGGQGGEHAGGGHMLFVTDLKMVSDSCKK